MAGFVVCCKQEFLDEFDMSQNALARAINVPSNRIHEIVKGKRSVTADTDLRVCRFFELTEGYFLRLQLSYELLEAKRKLIYESNSCRRHAIVF